MRRAQTQNFEVRRVSVCVLARDHKRQRDLIELTCDHGNVAIALFARSAQFRDRRHGQEIVELPIYNFVAAERAQAISFATAAVLLREQTLDRAKRSVCYDSLNGVRNEKV